MKVAYISPVYFSDVDLSLLPSLMEEVDIDYYIPISTAVHKGAAIAVDKVIPINDIIGAESYEELGKLSNILPVKRCYVINNCCKRLRSIKSFWLSFKFYKFLRRKNYDVIHITEFPKIHEFFIYLLRSKIVLTVHDPFPHSCVNSKSITFERWFAFKVIKKFILLNQSQKEDFINVNKIPRDSVYLSRLSCYDYLHIYDKSNKNILPLNNYVLFFGQITSHKGVDDLLSAMMEIHKIEPNLQLVVAGKWKWDYNYDLYESLDYIHIINKFIPDNELASYIQNAKFVVVPYHDATQSGVVMSAFAYNKPCIATNVGGLPEMVIDGKFGRIVEPKDRTSLAKVIVEMYKNPLELGKYSKNIEIHYHSGDRAWSAIAKKLFEIYKDFSDC